MAPADLFDEMIEFKIYNSFKYQRDCVIGSFKMDIGYVYDEKNHSLVSKWLLLSDTEDMMSGAKGYLKVTINVLGPGDEVPVFIFTFINLKKAKTFFLSVFIFKSRILIHLLMMTLKVIF
jgi:hypothetical protein